MRYGSVCSGIEAATVAWHPLGWSPVFFSEIEPFPCEVLKQRWPHVPNLGDMTRYREWELDVGAIDVLVGGTPCQSFSVAGLRKGLGDPRGNLALVYLGIAERIRPKWIVWENVPGVLSSNGGRDFGSFLGALAQLGYGFAYRVLDAQFFGVAQRRRRVFVVGYLGDWRRAAAVLFERESLHRNSKKSGKAGKEIALGTRGGTEAGGWPKRVAPTLNAAFGKKLGLEDQHALGGGAYLYLPTISRCLNAGGMGRQDYETETLIGGFFSGAVTQYGDKAGALTARHDSSPCADRGQNIVAFNGRENGGGQVAVAFAENSRGEVRLEGGDGSRAGAISHGGGKPGQGYPAIAGSIGVRRLTPTECERLQGFPDGHTLVEHRGKPAVDGPRYKAIGNSMAVPVMTWIGRRIMAVDNLL